jgi:hypothetical protein
MLGRRNVPKKNRSRLTDPISVEERIGRIWGGIFVGIVVVLLITLVGKGCFFAG